MTADAAERVARPARDYSTSYQVDRSPDEVYAAILDVGAWWTGQIDGPTDVLGAEFGYWHRPGHYSRQRVVDLEPGRRVSWRVIDSHLPGLSDPAEWTGSEIVFDIVPAARGAELRFTHVGLRPDVECYDACSMGWRHYVEESLRSLITAGHGLPDPW